MHNNSVSTEKKAKWSTLEWLWPLIQGVCSSGLTGLQLQNPRSRSCAAINQALGLHELIQANQWLRGTQQTMQTKTQALVHTPVGMQPHTPPGCASQKQRAGGAGYKVDEVCGAYCHSVTTPNVPTYWHISQTSLLLKFRWFPRLKFRVENVRSLPQLSFFSPIDNISLVCF